MSSSRVRFSLSNPLHTLPYHTIPYPTIIQATPFIPLWNSFIFQRTFKRTVQWRKIKIYLGWDFTQKADWDVGQDLRPAAPWEDVFCGHCLLVAWSAPNWRGIYIFTLDFTLHFTFHITFYINSALLVGCCLIDGSFKIYTNSCPSAFSYLH